MKGIGKLLVVSLMTAGCTTGTADTVETGIRTNKVADQHLASYLPVRRLTYRAACGSEGPLTLCVNRITISEHATLVEATLKNASPDPYVLSAQNDGGVLLADGAGAAVVQEKAESLEVKGLEERDVSFRMEGSFSGEPTVLMADNIRRKDPKDRHGGVSIMVSLGG